jgi:hypothetical protein
MLAMTTPIAVVSTIDFAAFGAPLTCDRTPDLESLLLLEDCSTWLAPQDGKPLSAVSLRVAPSSPRVSSFAFDAPLAATPRPPQTPAAHPISPSPPRLPAPSAQTRIAPPGDVIKLEDRLYYLLQPPLESLLTSDALHFPFEPFSYQFQGVAFLYPRYSAILADEMGLGKTMQAITAIRMLLRSGEVRSVLLICPKPLVTNWRREFGMWAPEIPLTIVEGYAAKRQWQWTQEDAPVTRVAQRAMPEWQESRGGDLDTAAGRPATVKAEPRAADGQKVGRNDPCHCGSGKKYKKCCLLKGA